MCGSANNGEGVKEHVEYCRREKQEVDGKKMAIEEAEAYF